MKNAILIVLAIAAITAEAKETSTLVPRPEPTFVPRVVKADEQPVSVSSVVEETAANGLYRMVKTTVTFTNPNARVFEGELVFPVPDGATVCGYELEVNGSMVPGVVVEKEAARTAFENEKRKGVDPGVVEHVKGNFWRTRIYPLNPKTPRRASVTVIEPIPGGELMLVERDGSDVFVGKRRVAGRGETRKERLSRADKATIFWDASFSRLDKIAADRELLANLPEKGEWSLVVFRNVVEKPMRFTDRAALLSAVDAIQYDGGTCLDEVRRKMDSGKWIGDKFLFTDEYDVEAAELRLIDVRKLAADEKPPQEPVEGSLLAVAWAANRVADLASQASSYKKELVEIGRRYGVASPATSLIVLESLAQYLQYKIEPPKCMSFHDEWVKRRAADDDPVAAKKAKAEHERLLLDYWDERVKWWNDPVPPKRTPKSGLFDRVVDGVRRAASFGRRDEMAVASSAMVGRTADTRAAASMETRARNEEHSVMRSQEMPASAPVVSRKMNGRSDSADSTPVATVKVAAWDPKTPYLAEIEKAKDAYAEYLVQRKSYSSSPAFFFDCAGWFFKKGDRRLGVRILSNLTEMKLEDAELWRTMGWRLREAGALGEAVKAFRHVLEMRGEEPQSRRDLALVLAERGKALYAANDVKGAKKRIEEAMKHLHKAAFALSARRSGRRGNDMQTSVIALEELNGLIAWCNARKWSDAPAAPKMDDAFRRDMPLDLRIMLSWDTDETDVDLHVLEPDGEEAYYGHRRTSTGGFVSEDVTTGYGPEEYLRKSAQKGKYQILANYFASHRQALTGAAVVTATVYTDWGRENEKMRILSFRLDKPKDKHPVGEVTME